MISLSCTKGTGAGNDFVILDEFSSPLNTDLGTLTRALCDRHFGIGADGVLILRPHLEADFEMLYYNADGSRGAMCGNGGRCAARYARERGIAADAMRFVALEHLYRAEVRGDAVRLTMKDPVQIDSDRVLEVSGRTFRGRLLDTGAPHLVVFTEGLDGMDVESLGHALRHHADLAPQGANVNFVERSPGALLRLRTYERGVERETLACGTGSVASAVAGALAAGLTSPVTVHVRSGDRLMVHFVRTGDRFSGVVLEGPARMLFTARCRYDEASGGIVAETSTA